MITVKGINNQVGNPEPQPRVQDPQPRAQARAPQDALHAQAQLAKRLGATVEITGSWCWASWRNKPSAEVREVLKANSWIWCKNKGKWAWRAQPGNGHKPMSWEYITAKYGLEQLDAKELVEV